MKSNYLGKKSDVSLEKAMADDNFLNDKSKLSLLFGTDDNGDMVIKDLTKIGSILTFGDCGTGYSLFLLSTVMSLKNKYSEDYLEVVVLNPAGMELSQFDYDGGAYKPISYLYDSVVVGLVNLLSELQNRQNQLNAISVSNIEEYNESEEVKAGKKNRMPYKTVIIYDYFCNMLKQYFEDFDKFMSKIKELKDCGIYVIALLNSIEDITVNKKVVECFDTQVIFKLSNNPKWSYDRDGICRELQGCGDMIICCQGEKPIRCLGYCVVNECKNGNEAK